MSAFRRTLEVLVDLMLQIRNKSGDSRVNSEQSAGSEKTDIP